MLPRLVPWEYAVRNLLRRPGRSALTWGALSVVLLMVFVVVGFIRGLQITLAISGDARTVIVHSNGTEENLEYSSVEAGVPGQLRSLNVIAQHYDQPAISPEVFLGTNVSQEVDGPTTFGLVRGVTPAVLGVRRSVQIIEGQWPGPGEVLVGRLVAAKLGWTENDLSIGSTLRFEGRAWRVAGSFAARGAVFESEIWAPLDELQNAMKRKDLDLSLVAVSLRGDQSAEAGMGRITMFTEEQQALELDATSELSYYENQRRHYEPVMRFAWLVVAMMFGAGVFAGLNTMYGAAAGRVRELATLQTIGFTRPAIALSLIQESALLAVAAALTAATLALLLVNGLAVRFTMGAFALRIDSTVVLVGCLTGLLLGIVGAIPPAVRALRMSIVEGLKSV